MPPKKKSTITALGAFDIKSFCEAYGLSRSYYYVLRARKQAPREMKIGRRVLISTDAATAWRRAHEKRQASSPTPISKNQSSTAD
jgi:predicted DNA-binding transcriptional regulator AlpA